MARTMMVDNTEIDRALVTTYGYSGKIQQAAYGPHGSKAHARDHNAKWRLQPTRVEKQKLVPAIGWFEGHTAMLGMEWETIETKYTNGGEDVNWDA